MAQSGTVITIGAICFGLVVGYIASRILARSTANACICNIASVIAVVGGGAVTLLFDPQESDAFGWYSIGLLIGIAIYTIVLLIIQGKKQTGAVIGDTEIRDSSGRLGGGGIPPD
jgi:hypothetical protein